MNAYFIIDYTTTIMASYGGDENANISQDAKMTMASKFVLQSPPGEINDVLNGEYLTLTTPAKYLIFKWDYWLDIRTIIADDQSLEVGLSAAIVEYNITQFTVVDVPGQSHKVPGYPLRRAL